MRVVASRLNRLGLPPKWLFSAIACVLACSLPGWSQTPAQEASIAGQVLLDGNPVPQAVVLLQPHSSQAPQRTKTDGDGRFRFAGLSAGIYSLGALTPKFISVADAPHQPGKIITLKAGENLEDVEIVLKRGGVITGRITDGNKEPVVEIQVQLARLDESGKLSQPIPYSYLRGEIGKTDDRGVYRYFGLSPGKYRVSAGLPIREGSFTMQTSRTFYPETFHPDTPDEKKAKIIELAEGEEVSDVDITLGELKKSFEVSGRVINTETGHPVPNALLTYINYDQQGKVIGMMQGGWRSDANGEFFIVGIRAGKHGLSLNSLEGNSELYSQQTQFSVTDQDVSGIEVRARRGASLSGTVVIEGTNDPAQLAKRAQLTLSLTAFPLTFHDETSFAKTTPDGSFRFTAVSPGVKRLANAIQIPDLSLLRVEKDGVPVNNSEFTIRAGETLTGLRVIVAYGNGVIRGQVRLVNGVLPQGLALLVGYRRADQESQSFHTTPVDMRGEFFVTGLLAGEYELGLFPNFSGPATEQTNKVIPLLGQAKQKVSVSHGAATQITLTLDLKPQETER